MPFFGGKRRVVFFIVVLLYASFVAFFPWADYRSRGFTDLDVYISNFENEVYSAEFEGLSVVGVFSGEVLWRLLVYGLIDILGDAALVFKLVTFFVSAVFSYILVSRSGSLWSVFFLFNPVLLDLELSQIRSGFGMSLLYIAFCIQSWTLRVPVVVSALFVHSAMLVMSAVRFVCEYIQGVAQRGARRGVLYFGFFLAFLVLLMAMRGVLLSEMGDRRADLQTPASGMLFTALWVVVAVPIAFRPLKLVLSVENMYAVIFLILFGALSVLGAYGSRYVALAYPFIVSSLYSLRLSERRVFLGYLAAFQSLHMSMWW